jgi:hypothetical protein
MKLAENVEERLAENVEESLRRANLCLLKYMHDNI